ncbi:cell wall hydrolase [Sphingomonas qomolangmaensis]|uniref:Cell wall hydrolase n=1 Tax=Sphingomonas qomolangmaensis TaxID=2918765 RepID=A0ABY5L8J4_9SPHN|nr:cell wall hydrolase [Sphingomonas qomolangmaensis]UUL82388.1 cell wall hydrolase [Sphingomonas qomolangmaensis]
MSALAYNVAVFAKIARRKTNRRGSTKEKANMDRSVQLLGALIGLAAMLIIGGMLAVSFALKNGEEVTAQAWKGRSDAQRALPPLPKAGMPGVVTPENELLPVLPETARRTNAMRPFSDKLNASARPFSSVLSADDRERAIACLAIAALYEAGGIGDDQYPVMQVILNRVRHPAFPGSICGVVFQGAERSTGCQFSFACDESMARWRPSDRAITEARARAAAMLDSHVDRRVGLATHYHTDWVLPYWSNSLDKITAIKTHLFFRWRGYWGTLASFRQQSNNVEPRIAALAALSSVHLAQVGQPGDPSALADIPVLSADAVAGGDDAVTVTSNARAGEARIAVLNLPLDPDSKPGGWSLNALALCGKRPECRAVGWIDPTRRPATFDAASLAASPPDFVFVQELRNRTQQPYWDCTKHAKASMSRCLESSDHPARLVYGG